MIQSRTELPPYLLMKKYELMAKWFGRTRPVPKDSQQEKEDLDTIRAENAILKVAFITLTVAVMYGCRKMYKYMYNTF